MSFATLAAQSGKEAVAIAELYLDRCQHRYGEGPCTAAIPTTGDAQCFNTVKTCQDRENYQRNAEPVSLHSEALDNAYWTEEEVTATADAETAPWADGTVNLVTETSATDVHRIVRAAVVVTEARRLTLSTWFKRNAGTHNIGISIEDTSAVLGGDVSIIIDPDTGFIESLANTDGYRVEDYGDGWWRLSITTPEPSGDGIITIVPVQFFDGVTASFAGDTDESVFAFGAVAFNGEYATGYGTQEDVFAEFNNPMRIRFATSAIDGLQLYGEPPVVPTLVGADNAPTVLTPGAGLGIRASASLSLQDAPFTDVALDPYRSVRGIDWMDGEHGTLLGRLFARNPNFENRRMDVLVGFHDSSGRYAADNFQRRTYIIESTAGPAANGAATIRGKDPLKLADATRRTCPTSSRAKLFADIDFDEIIFEVIDQDGTLLAAYNAGQTYLVVDGEIMEQVAAPIVSFNGYTLTVDRGVSPSFYENDLNDRREHKAGTTVQHCHFFDGVRIDEIVYELLSTFSGIPSEYLPLVEWDEEIDMGGMNSYVFRTLIAKPVGVSQLLIELTQHNLMLWWDERRRVVRLRPLNFVSLGLAPIYNDRDNIVADAVQTSMDMKRRVSQVWLYSAHRFPTKDLSPEYFGALRLAVDLDRESEEEYGSPRLAAFASRWLRVNDAPIAVEVASRYLRNYRDGKRVTTIRVDAKDFSLWTGDKVRVITQFIQDENGLPNDQTGLITQIDEVWSPRGLFYDLVVEQEATATRTALIAPDSIPDYGSATDEQKLRYLFIAPNTNEFSDGEPAYTIS